MPRPRPLCIAIWVHRHIKCLLHYCLERRTKVQNHRVRPTVSSGSSDDTHRTHTRRSRRSNNQTTQAVGIPVQVRPEERYQKVSSRVHSTPNDNTHVRPKSTMNSSTIPQRRSTIQPRLGENYMPRVRRFTRTATV